MLCHWRYVLDNLFGEVQGGELPRRDPHPRARRRGRPAPTTPTPTMPPTRPSSSRAASIAQINPPGRARPARRPRHLPGRRHAWLGGRRADALLDPAPGQHAAAGVEPGPAADDGLLRPMGRGAGQRRSTTTASRRSGRMFLRHVVEDAPWRYDLDGGRQGRAARRTRPEELARAPLARRPRSARKSAAKRDLTTSTLPAADGAHRALHDPQRAAGRAARATAERRASTASPMPPRMSSPIRCADNDPWLDAGDRLGAHDRLPPLSLGSRLRRRRGDGYRAARHGPRLARRAGADPALRSADAKARPGALIACGAGTDHLAPGPDVTIDDVIRAYEEQIEAVEGVGGRIILMASRALAAAARGPDDYVRVYDRILSPGAQPVIIHWLGEMFDPALAGYWGDADHIGGDGDVPRRHRRPCRQGRRHQDLAAVEGEGDRHAPPAARRACACIPATTSTMPS